MDIKLSSLTGDLDLSSDGLSTCTGGEEARQRIDLAINLNIGEFFSHINYGLPWIENKEEDSTERGLRYFLGDKMPNPDIFVQNELDKYLSTLPIVSSVESDTEYNQSTRLFEYSYKVITVDGEEINFPPYLQQL